MSVTLLSAHTRRVTRLYRSSLKNLLNWCVHRDLFITKSLELRAEFDANKHIAEAQQLEKVLVAGEAKLREYAHPDPYTRARGAPRITPLRPPLFLPCAHDAPLYAASMPPSLPLAVPHMPGGSKYMRHPNNGLGPPAEVRSALCS
jgi:hypothetical protein